MTAALRPIAPEPTRGFALPTKLSPSTIDHLIAFGASLLIAIVLFVATPFDGIVGFVVVQFLLYAALLYAITMRTHSRQVAFDRVVTSLIITAAVLTLLPIVSVIGYVIYKGAPSLSLNFFTQNMSGVDPSAPATEGGAIHAILGTLQQVGIATVLAVPLGVLTAVYLVEISGPLAIFKTPVRVIINAMSGLPSIVAGLFIFTVWGIRLGFKYSGFAAALALAMLMLPTIARTTEEMLRIVSPGLREASLALGSPQWRTIFQVVVPTARAGIVTAVILGIARVAGETAPLIMTAFGSDTVNNNPLSQPQSALPLFVFSQSRQPGPALERAWAGALVLICLVLVLFVLARIVGRSQKVNH